MKKTFGVSMKTNFDRRIFLVGLLASCVGSGVKGNVFAIEGAFGDDDSSKRRRFETRRGVFTFQTDFELSEIASEIASLDALTDELTQTLRIPPPRERILARIFADETSWRAFFKANFPGVAYRAAMFEQKDYLFDSWKRRLYAFRGSSLGVDLRHEATHALLASSLRRTVPLWLDEGLAEYFEETPKARLQSGERKAKVVARLENGAFSSLELLESVSNISSATSAFYLDSWAWANYLLNDSSKTRDVLSEYLNDLARSRPFAPKVSARLKKIGGGEDALRRFYSRFAAYERA